MCHQLWCQGPKCKVNGGLSNESTIKISDSFEGDSTYLISSDVFVFKMHSMESHLMEYCHWSLHKHRKYCYHHHSIEATLEPEDGRDSSLSSLLWQDHSFLSAPAARRLMTESGWDPMTGGAQACSVPRPSGKHSPSGDSEQRMTLQIAQSLLHLHLWKARQQLHKPAFPKMSSSPKVGQKSKLFAQSLFKIFMIWVRFLSMLF